MSQKAIDLFLARIKREEGDRLLPYDDATAKPVTAPVGNLSWGHGYNLMQCGSEGLFAVMDAYLAGECEKALRAYDWYCELDTEPARQSVFLDIAYNAGVHGLLHFPKMLGYAHARDWPNCAAQCKVADARLDASRYAPLRALLQSGDTAL
jgi:GH24 family phage-related lysozyme (muramidase)